MSERIIPDETEAEAHYNRMWEAVAEASLRATVARVGAPKVIARPHASPYANVLKPYYVEATSYD